MTRRLSPLEKQVEAYSIKAWYTVPPAGARRGADPNAAREPLDLPTDQRLAARVVDELVGSNPANLGFCDCPPCACVVYGADGKYAGPCEHDRACPHDGRGDDPAKVSARLMAFAAERSPRLAHALSDAGGGVEEVYDMAGLTPAERQVARYKHQGLTHCEIAALTRRSEGTCFALYSRARQELQALGQPERVAA